MTFTCVTTGGGLWQLVVLTTKGKEEHHHVLWVAVFPSFHVDLYPRFDRLFPVWCQKPVEDSQLIDALDFLEKLTGGTGTLIRVLGQLGLEVGLHPLGVLGRSGRSVVRRHLRIVRECVYIVAGFIRVEARTTVRACGGWRSPNGVWQVIE